MDLEGTGREGVNWIHLAQDMVQWRALVNTAMNVRVSKKRGIYWRAERLSAFQGTSFSMELVSHMVTY
jgi:hypothetical protein